MTRADLTHPQWGTLCAIAATRGVGHDEAELDMRSVRALDRRGLVEKRGSAVLSRVERWFATLQGFDLIAQDKRDRGIGQGPLRRITPSRRDPWEGARTDQSRFTADQVLQLDKMRIDHSRVPFVIVSVEVPEDEHYVPIGQARPVRRYACPRVGMCRKPGFEGRDAILTPSGEFAGVLPDGTDPRLYGAKERAPYGREAWW